MSPSHSLQQINTKIYISEYLFPFMYNQIFIWLESYCITLMSVNVCRTSNLLVCYKYRCIFQTSISPKLQGSFIQRRKLILLNFAISINLLKAFVFKLKLRQFIEVLIVYCQFKIDR